MEDIAQILLYDACVQTIIRDPDLWYSRRLYVVRVVRRFSSRQPDFLFLLADPIRMHQPHSPRGETPRNRLKTLPVRYRVDDLRQLKTCSCNLRFHCARGNPQTVRSFFCG